MTRPTELAPPRASLPDKIFQKPETAVGRNAPGGRRDLLIAELNHRIRNILNLIRSLVAQSVEGSQSVEQFAETIGRRIDALARAHDQVTRSDMSPASLHELIHVESLAYAGSRAERIVVEGPDALIAPDAFTTLALVIHELLTNSCKYGALSNSAGTVAIVTAAGADRSLRIAWTESGGPPVAPPTRRGFGSTIIERTIPHELDGTAEIEFARDGLLACFGIPARNVAVFDAPAGSALVGEPEADHAQERAAVLRSGAALIVEDNVIIAMEAEDLLHSIGFAECHIVGSVEAALRRIEQGGISFAMLDVNLGGESGEAIAAVLRDAGTPFIFASGYGERIGEFAEIPVVTKPYSEQDILSAIARLHTS